MWWIASAFAGQGFLAEELGIPAATMPEGTTEIAECLVTASLGALAAPDAPPSAAYDPNGHETAYTVEIPDAYRAGAPKVIATGVRSNVKSVTGCPEPYAAAAKALVEASPVRDSSQREFEGRDFDVRVVFAPPSLIRLIVTPPPPSLASATAIPTAPEKTFDRELFRPREMKAESCPVTVFIDEHGDVYAADLAACRADARLFMKSALLAWKYAPVVVDGKPVPAKFSVAVVLR